MYHVPKPIWVRVSRMHFRGAAGRWISSLDQPDRLPWLDFCQLLHNCFGRDQRDMLVRQMFHISQTTTVLDYAWNVSLLCLTNSKLTSPNLIIIITSPALWMA